MSKTGIFGSEAAQSENDVMPAPWGAAVGGNALVVGPPNLNHIFSNLTINTLYFAPVLIPNKRDFTTILVQNNGAAAAGGRVRIGLYNCRTDSTYGGKILLPADLIFETGELATDVAAGDITAAITRTLEPGIYLAATLINIAASLRRFNGTTEGFWMYTFAGGNMANVTGLSRAYAYGALPADESAQAAAGYANAQATVVALK